MMVHDSVGREESGYWGRERSDQRWGNQTLVDLAREAAHADETMSVLDAIKDFPHAVGWSLLISICVIMDGYDSTLIGNFLAFPSFQRQFGDYVGITPQTPSGYQLKPAWAAALGQASGIGFFFGVLLNGYVTPKYGNKRVVVVGLVVMSALLLITFFARSVRVLLVGQILVGLTWGIFATSAPAYASEVLPTALRTYLTSCTNMCYLIGNLLSAVVLKAFSSRIDLWGYRIPLALQWIWPAFLVPAIWFAPESPWFLARQGRLDEAEESLRRLRRNGTSRTELKQTLASIVYTNDLERRLSVGSSYWHCFKGFELRRTEIACLCSVGQILSGYLFGLNSSYFFEAVGLGTDITFSLAVGGPALGLLGTLINWFVLMPRFGRRPIYIWGMASMSLVWCLVGVLNVWTRRYQVAIAQAVFSLAWTFIYHLSVGQLGWALPAEIGSTRLRQKTICLGRLSVAVSGTLSGVLQQYMVNTNVDAGGWNLRGYAGFVWCGTAFLMTIWAFFRLPETQKRSFQELDVLFARRIPARKMASTAIDAFDEHEVDRLALQHGNVERRRWQNTGHSTSATVVSNSLEPSVIRASVVNHGEMRQSSTNGSATTRLK